MITNNLIILINLKSDSHNNDHNDQGLLGNIKTALDEEQGCGKINLINLFLNNNIL